ncbi:MAG: TonB-dependent receptor [Deltaproteobacteria bacterium]|nr:TonB-dependent receptor [Deltaproteobacteria bacterium]
MLRCVKIVLLIFSIPLLFGDIPMICAQDLSTDEFTLEEITVTAQKREENQQKVAIAMEVVSGDEIKELGRNDIDEILSNVSSVLINKATDGLRVTIRGVSNDNPMFNNVQVSTPTVAINKDGVYTNRNDSGSGLYDVERVEVLFGPQSTLYATASPGGIVNIVSASPKTDKYEASGTLEYGNYNLLSTDGSMNAPISDTLAVRAAFSTTVRDGYLTNGADDEDMKSARIRTLFKPGDNFSLIISGEISKTGGKGWAGVAAFEDQGDVDNPWTSSSDSSGPPRFQSQKRIYANLNLDIGLASLTVVPNYMKRTFSATSIMQMGPSTVTSTITGSGYEKGAELRMASSQDFYIKWIAGFNWYKSNDESANTGDNGSWGNRFNLQTSKALYGNITYPINDKFRATGGMRVTWEDNDSINTEYPDARPPFGISVQEVHMSYKGKKDYKVGAEYDVGADSMLYMDWSTSYRTRGMDYRTSGEPFPPEKLTSYTIGSKNRFMDNKLQINGAAYYYNYKNYLADSMVMSLHPVTMSPQPDDNSKNVGDSKVYGVDLQANTIITDKDKLDLSVSYLKSEFTKLAFDYMDITNSLGIPDADYSGQPMTLSPSWTINAAYSHNFMLWNNGTLTFRLDARYQSSYILQWASKSIGYMGGQVVVTDSTAMNTQEAHHISNISAIYAHPDGKWTLTGYVKNLEDYAVKRSWMMMDFIIGPPRTYGGVLSVKF